MLGKLATSLVAVLMIGGPGCAMDAQEDASGVARTEQALSLASDPKGAAPLFVRATWDPQLETTMVDVSTSWVPPIDVIPTHDPHNGDQFLSAQAFTFRGGKRVNLATLGAKQIGPGGGCIHFSVPANVGELVYVGAIVSFEGDAKAGAAVGSPVPVVVGDWVNDPTVALDPDHP